MPTTQMQRGSGYLVLKSGARKEIVWEIELLDDCLLGDGSLLGDNKHLAAAAEDGCANLELSVDKIAAIAIDNYNEGKASFKILLFSGDQSAFHELAPPMRTVDWFFKSIKTWQVGRSENGFVCLRLDGDQLALTPSSARQFAAELIEHATKIEKVHSKAAH